MFGTKCPAITSICRTVPPPSRAALVSTPSCAKFAARMDGTSSILDNASLLGQRSPRLYAQHLGYLGEMYYIPQRHREFLRIPLWPATRELCTACGCFPVPSPAP